MDEPTSTVDLGLRPTAPPHVAERAGQVAESEEGLRSFIGAGAGPIRDRQRSYPGDELDPATVQSIFREADKGYWLNRYGELWDDLRQRDYQIANLDRGRRVGITTKKWLVHPSDPRDEVSVGLADVTRAMFDQLDGFDASVYSMLSANGPGYSLMEPIYRFGTLRFTWRKATQTLGGLHPRELRWIHQRHLYFSWDTDEPYLDMGSDGKLPLAEAPHKLFLYQTIGDGIASARGFLRPAAWLHLLGQSSMVSGGIFLRRFGIPPIAAFIGQKYWKDEALKAEIITHLQNYGNGDPAIFPEWMKDAFKVDPTAVATGASNLHMQWRGFIDACLAKCIQGAVLQSEASGGGPGSYALGAVHEAKSYDVSVVDAIGSSERLRTGLVRAWIDLNKKALAKIFSVPPEDLLWRLPLLSRRIDRETSAKERAEILCMFADRGLVGSVAQVRSEYAFDAPVDDADRFTGKPVTVSSGGVTVSPADASTGVDNPKPEKPAAPAQEAP